MKGETGEFVQQEGIRRDRTAEGGDMEFNFYLFTCGLGCSYCTETFSRTAASDVMHHSFRLILKPIGDNIQMIM